MEKFRLDDIILTDHVKERYVERFKALNKKSKIQNYISQNDFKLHSEIVNKVLNSKKSFFPYYQNFYSYNLKLYGKNDYCFLENKEVLFVCINLPTGLLVKTCLKKNQLFKFLEEKYGELQIKKETPVVSNIKIDKKSDSKKKFSTLNQKPIVYTDRVKTIKNIKVYQKADFSIDVQNYYWPQMEKIVSNRIVILRRLLVKTKKTGSERIIDVADRYIQCLEDLKTTYIKGSFQKSRDV